MKSKAKSPQPRPRRNRELVWVDQGPLRRKAASECGRAMQRLETARAEWKRFEVEDQPAYRRWEAATFGALMTRIRETEALVRDKQVLVREVETEMFFGGAHSYRAAYAQVQKRRANPTPEPKAQKNGRPHARDGWEFDADEEDEEMNEFTETLLFEEFLRTFLGMNPDRMSDRQYDKMFADFQANVLGKGEPRAFGDREYEAEPERNFAPEPAKPVQARVKELYRLLVRRLHPDMRADNNAEVSALWHEVQEAYATENVDRLEMLLAFTDIQAKKTGEHTTLFQMRSVLAELRSAYNALQRNLRAAKKDRAWGFARLADRSKVAAQVQREMEAILAVREEELRELQSLLAKWSAPGKGRGSRPKPAMEQESFPF
jgi:hypothetical protein